MLVFMNEGSEIWFNTCLPFLWNMHVTRLGFSFNTCCVSKLPLFVCRQSVTTEGKKLYTKLYVVHIMLL
jgi:hypothetical protein